MPIDDTDDKFGQTDFNYIEFMVNFEYLFKVALVINKYFLH